MMVMALMTVTCIQLAGCGSTARTTAASDVVSSSDSTAITSETEATDETGSAGSTQNSISGVNLQFGSDGAVYTLNFDDNETAAELAGFVGEDGMNLPIYHFDDFDHSDVMQYYDMPSSFQVTSDPQHITAEKAGEVYYSDPDRIILFYKDADIEGDFTRVGSIADTKGLADAVVNNPVLEGWGDKIISIQYAQ